MSYRVGVDIGGTFTDICLLDEATGATTVYKLRTSTGDPSEAMMQGILEILAANEVTPGELRHVAHGSTIGINALLQRRGVRTALVTTAGFGDLLEIGRQTRPDLYSLQFDKPEPFVSPELIRCVPERMLYTGEVRAPLDEGAVRNVIAELRSLRVEAVAVCFLHAYANPAHEQRVLELFGQDYPEAYVSISSDVIREFREYERLSSTVINACIGPLMKRYLDRLEDRLRENGVCANLYICASNGGVMSAATAKNRPLTTIASGPAAGVAGAIHVAGLSGMRDLLTMDIGGTSVDVCLVRDAQPSIASVTRVAGFPAKTPMIDIHSAGAGGGSIAWIDRDGLMKVGPASAGAHPGPACYNSGGVEPTVTDAQLVLGRLSATHRLAGKMALDPESAARAIRRVGEPLGLDLQEAASGILRIMESNTVQALRQVSVRRGYDPRDFVLMAFGGAGPLHAIPVAKDLGMTRVLVPRYPGILCAIGELTAEIRRDYSRSQILAQETITPAQLTAIFAEMDAQADAWLAAEGVAADRRRISRSIDMRYRGQNYELPVAAPAGEFDERALRSQIESFHDAHKRAYGYAVPDEPVVFVTFRVVAQGSTPPVRLERSRCLGADPAQALIETRPVYFPESAGPLATPVYDGARIPAGAVLEGPAVIALMDSSILITPDWKGRIDEWRNWILEPKG